jgi:hypothetical protein
MEGAAAAAAAVTAAAAAPIQPASPPPLRLLPLNLGGTPKRAGPFIAAAIPHLARCTNLISVSNVELPTGGE